MKPTTMLSLIVAVDEKGGIGRENQLPWRLPADLKRFKTLTMGHPIVMGRKTYDSIGRALPGRTSIIITHQAGFQAEGCLVALNLEQALAIAQSISGEIFVIGGGQIFAQALPLADQIYLTRVHTRVEADTFFPAIELGEWVEVECSEHPADEKNPFAHTFQVLKRVQNHKFDS